MFEEEYLDGFHGEEHESLNGSDSYIADSLHGVINEHEDITDCPKPSAPYNPSFGQGLLVDLPDDAPNGTLAPYDDTVSTNLIHRVEDPFSLDVSGEDVSKLKEKAQDIERECHTSSVSFGKKVCPTSHGCSGATYCNGCIGDYPY